MLSASVSGLQRCLNTVFFALVWNFNSNLIAKNHAVLPLVQDITNAIHLFNLVLSFLGGTQLLSIWALFSVLELLLMLTQMLYLVNFIRRVTIFLLPYLRFNRFD